MVEPKQRKETENRPGIGRKKGKEVDVFYDVTVVTRREGERGYIEAFIRAKEAEKTEEYGKSMKNFPQSKFKPLVFSAIGV